jgi:hypothetical protein
LPEVGLSFNVGLIFPILKGFLHNGENPLNCSAARSALVGSELTSETVQEVGTHARIIAVRESGGKFLGVWLEFWTVARARRTVEDPTLEVDSPLPTVHSILSDGCILRILSANLQWVASRGIEVSHTSSTQPQIERKM